jgi:hypothetical protein
MVFNATFNNISVISWLSCFIGGVYQENHRPTASLTNLINNVVSNIIDLSQKKQLLDLKVKGQGSTKVIMDMQHTTLWICTHIPIIIDLPRKTKMLWPGQENTI